MRAASRDSRYGFRIDLRAVCLATGLILACVLSGHAQVLDTTGAGDLFAAGLLFGLTHGLDPVESTRLGGLCAAEVISHTGARPEADLKRLAADAGLLPG